MKIIVHVTKEILERAAYCGTKYGDDTPSQNCAIALAVREIAPSARVGVTCTYWAPALSADTLNSEKVVNFVCHFDNLTALQRMLMPEQSFEMNFPDSMVEEIGIEEATRIISQSKTLELV